MKCITTIILNWNRSRLLEETLSSYYRTVSGASELIVVDNASTDDSKAVIQRFPVKTAIYLQENIGGEALNVAIEKASGELVNLSENDQSFLDGWPDHVRASFDAFPGLGQLSLHGVVPSDDEAWEAKPGHLRYRRGKILYEAEGNVGTSSVLPISIFREHGITIHNLPANGLRALKFPDDGRLSTEVKAVGLWCAWSDRYWVRNLGHEMAEFEREPDYYRENYSSKPWLGIEGWERRMAQWRDLPRPRRRSLVFPGAHLQPEKTSRTVGGMPARLWSMFDGYTAEAEVLDALYALTRLVKPAHVVETGTWLGRAAAAIAMGLRDNGFGRLTTIEIDPEVAENARATIAQAGLAEWTNIIVGSSLDFWPESEVQFALLNSGVPIRQKEFRHFYEKLAPGALVAFHDTGPQHQGLSERVRELIAEGKLEGCFLQTPRGLFIGTVVRPPLLSSPAWKPDASSGDIDALRARIAALETSTSWRVTRPLRFVKELLAARRHIGGSA